MKTTIDLNTACQQIKLLSPPNQTKLRQYLDYLLWCDEQERQANIVSWNYSFVDAFREANVFTTQDSAGMDIRIEAAAVGGDERPALWAHPPIVGQAVIEYYVPIPQEVKRLWIEVAIGVRDGAAIDKNNLVAFSLRVNGLRVWGTQTNQLQWQSVKIPLDVATGDICQFEFATEALGTHKWTWAVWGTPQLMGQVRKSKE